MIIHHHLVYHYHKANGKMLSQKHGLKVINKKFKHDQLFLPGGKFMNENQ
ncbi:unnamed protein product [Wuchereria bancrofti]|uniref:Uncharacterized protein n=1 Tax=Wuchereria bancrofti TaxID=6293 RepID=A0A3P7EA17_WUCBA|nr:unnamed protein product [Wuchereria bancrofti]